MRVICLHTVKWSNSFIWPIDGIVSRRNVLLHDRPHSARIRGKNIGLRLVCSSTSTIFTRPFTKWFSSFSFSTKCSEWQTDFLKKIRWKSYLINGKNWFKITVNIQLIEINSLLNYSWINSILLKQKLFMSKPKI